MIVSIASGTDRASVSSLSGDWKWTHGIDARNSLVARSTRDMTHLTSTPWRLERSTHNRGREQSALDAIASLKLTFEGRRIPAARIDQRAVDTETTTRSS
jgi:hypothetical protein